MGAFSLIVVINLLNRSLKMFSNVEIQLVFNAEYFSVESLFKDDYSTQSIVHKIVDSSNEGEIGKIIFTSKETPDKNESFEALKSSLKRLYGSLNTQQAKTKAITAGAKIPRVTQVKPTANDTAFKKEIAPAKIDVNSLMSIIEDMATREKSYKCSFCGSESTAVTSMRRHIQTKHMPNSATFNCLTCDYSTKHKFVLKNHYMNKHGMPEPAAQAMMINYCKTWRIGDYLDYGLF